MRHKTTIALVVLLLATTASPQSQPQKPGDDQPIRITSELVQLDAVVTDKKGQIVRGLTKDDFELYEGGKRQQISFFEFVDAGKSRRLSKQGETVKQTDPKLMPGGVARDEVRRTFLFVVDDLTIPYQDLVYVRQMLTNFLDNQMQPTDLVSIVRTVGGVGLLQQLTSDKELIRRAIASLTPSLHPLSAFNNPAAPKLPSDPSTLLIGEGATSESPDISSPLDDTNTLLRSYMSIGTASFSVESMKQLPGRKSLVLISGGLPILSVQQGSVAGNVSNFLNILADQATRAGVVIHTMDIRGLQAQAGVSSFTDTPGRSAVGEAGIRGTFGRAPDEAMFGYRNPFDATQAHMGLRALAYATGGIAVLNKNDFDEGLGKILTVSEGYYLLAYAPIDNKFDGGFRKLEVKVKRDDVKVYSRRGYTAREERAAPEPTTKQDQLLAAIRSPLARRDIDLDAMLLYKAKSKEQGAIDIHMVIDPRKLDFETADNKQQTNFDVAGFVYDELGKMRGGFSETVTAGLTGEQYDRIKAGGFIYSASTTLAPGVYQIRLAVRDSKTGNVGTLSRYLEVPNLAKGRLSASSVLIGGVPAHDTKGAKAAPLSASRIVSRKQDLRYAVIIYNAKLRDGKPQLRTRLVINKDGQEFFKEPEEPLAVSSSNAEQVIKIGQLGLAGVKPGRYTLILTVTDTLAEKKAQTVTRSMDFVVVD